MTDETEMIEIVKRCACGKSYTRAAWAKLDYVGAQSDDVESLELRLCTCGSTIALAT